MDLPEVRLVNCKSLYFLENLRTLNLSDNLIRDFEEQVSPVLMTLHRLTSLRLANNPVTKVTPKYRDQVVILTKNQFTELDGKTIKMQERQYLSQLNARKQMKQELQLRK
jgi:Leucine-rich repeat (LRR) protein